jgi:HSP20 family protein
MANPITVKKGDGPMTAAAPRARDPLAIFDALMRWDPFNGEWPSLLDRTMPDAFMPSVDVKETPEAFVFTTDLPGVAEKDLDVSITGNRLTISGKREKEEKKEGEKFYSYERTFGSFSRTFTLPEGADAEKVAADMKGGVLTVSVGKRPEAQPKKVDVKSS